MKSTDNVQSREVNRRGLVRPRNRKLMSLDSGLTILELLLAIIIIGVALMLLALVMTSNLRGVREDGMITTANQAAVYILEDWRDRIYRDVDHIYDTGPQDGSYEVLVDGVPYVGSFHIAPQRVNDAGARTSVLGSTPDLFEVILNVTSPDGERHEYTALIARRQ